MSNISLYRYSDKELSIILRSITILCDTREQKNAHIKDYFIDNGISFDDRKLDYGDYSFFVPTNKDLGINRDMFFDDKIVIERKSGLEELSNCFSQGRTRFENEMLRSNKTKMILLIENASFQDIIDGKFKTDMSKNSFMASLFAFTHRYNLNIAFIDKKSSGKFIYGSFYYFLRELLR